MKEPQYIMKDGKPAFVVLPVEDYESLLSDEALFDRALAEDDGVRYPADVVFRRAQGENVVRVAREWRGMKQDELAEKAGLTPNFISMLENGKRSLTPKAAKKLAAALGVEYDFLAG